MASLLQVAAASIPPDAFTGHMTQLALAVLLGINAWQLRVTLQFRDDARKLHQWAFGPEGENGANSEIKAMRARTDTHGDEIHAVRGILQVHEIRLDGVERRNGPDDRRHPA